MADPKKDIDQQDQRDQQNKLGRASLPHKNAVKPSAGNAARHEERLLDDALESTFPASDPIAETRAICTPEQEAVLQAADELLVHEEFLLDEALDMTFPASDPIAIPDPGMMEKAIHSSPGR